MTIFLYGQDAYRLRQGSEQVLAGYRKKYPGSMNFFSFDLSDKEQRGRLEDTLKTVSFFEEAKLVVVRGAFVSKEISEWTEQTISDQDINTNRQIIMMLTEQSSRKDLEKINAKFFNGLSSKSSTVRNLEYLDGAKLVNWVRTEFASRNCSVDAVSGRSLIDLVGNESWRLVNEIEKLSNYKQKGTVTQKDMATLVSGRSDLNIFDFVDAVVSKNRAKAYELLYKELKSGRDPYYLLSMIVFGFRNMLMVKDLLDRKTSSELIAKKAGLHPFIVRKTSVNTSKFTAEELKASYNKLLDVDTLSKQGNLNLLDYLFNLVLS